MRTCLATFYPPPDDRLRFIKQLGIDDVIIWATTYQSKEDLSYKNLVALRNKIEDAGLSLYALETLPAKLYNKIMLGKEGRDEQIKVYGEIIDNLGRAGIKTLGYNWMPSGVWRTSYSKPLRGGAKGTVFNLEDIQNAPLSFDREYSVEEFWDYYQYWLEKIIPVAEAAGVRLSLHPNDPPMKYKIGGVPQLFHSRETINKAMQLVPSNNHGLTFCLGAWSAMGENIVDVVHFFGRQKKIHYVHFQSSNGSVPYFSENFVDQADYDPYEVVKALHEEGFNGVMIPGHVPQIEGDTEWRDAITASANTSYTHPMGGHRARAYTIGLMKGLIMSVKRDVPYKQIR